MGGLLDRYGRAREQTGRGAPHRLLRSPASTRPAYAQGVDDVERERRERMLAPEEMGDGETSERAILGLSQIDLHASQHGPGSTSFSIHGRRERWLDEGAGAFPSLPIARLTPAIVVRF